MPLSLPVDELLEKIESFNPDQLWNLKQEVLKYRPLTCYYTAAIAEHIVARYESRFPISIVRSSIIISAYNVPWEGFVYNEGLAEMSIMFGLGLLRTIDWNYYANSHLVPLDYVANCLICSAYAANVHSPNKLTIYNMTPHSSKPISWGYFFDLLRNETILRPPIGIIQRPIVKLPRRVNIIEFSLTKIFSERLFAYAKFLQTGSTDLIKITQLMHGGNRSFLPYFTNEWNFKTNNTVKLVKRLNDLDKELFQFDMREIDWVRVARSVHSTNLELYSFDKTLKVSKLCKC